MKKKKYSFKERFNYQFDMLMSKGTIAMILLLFAATVLVVVIIGAIASAFFGGGVGSQIWLSLMHALDAGTLASDATDHKGFVVLMSIMTLFGLFVTSILIGIITTGFENRLNDLKKSRSKVIDEGHTVIFGFNDGLYVILSSLIEANANHKKQCIVVVGEEDVETMEAEIRGRIDDFKTTHVIVKSGPMSEEYMFERAGVSNAKSVIINPQDDSQSVRILLALNSYIQKNPPMMEEWHADAVIHEKRYAEAAKIACGDYVDVINSSDVVSRIIAHTCSESGLSNVITEIFDYDGDELYFESVPECTGKKFSKILNLFPKQVVLGIENNGSIHLNPPMDTVIGEDDKIILMEEDDGAFSVSETDISVEKEYIAEDPVISPDPQSSLLVIGVNHELDAILMEYDKYVPEGTSVTIIAPVSQSADFTGLKLDHLKLNVKQVQQMDSRVFEQWITPDTKSVLLLTDYELDADTADSQTLLNLIDISTIEKKRHTSFFITSEIRKSANQKLAALIGADDFIIGSNIVGMIAAQVSEDRELFPLFHELLNEEGSEIYMKPAELYVKPGVDVNFYTITASAAARGEIALGYRKFIPEENRQRVITNPLKSEKVSFSHGDRIIVIAEDGTL